MPGGTKNMFNSYAIGTMENGVLHLLPLRDWDHAPALEEEKVCSAWKRDWAGGRNWANDYFDDLEDLRKVMLYRIFAENLMVEALRIRRYSISESGDCKMEQEWWWEDFGWPKWSVLREKKSGKYLSGTNFAYGGEGSTPIYADDALHAPLVFARGNLSMEMARRGLTFKDWELVEVKLPEKGGDSDD